MSYELKPVWVDYEKWEEYLGGMYDKKERINIINFSKQILSEDISLYTKMFNVTQKYPISSSVHLTQEVINPKAWLGQTCCHLICGATVNETSKAWTMLTKEQRQKANMIAVKVIIDWRQKYFEDLYGKECL